MAGGTILKLGYSDPLTDAFGAHPTLGAMIDLNDGATFTLVSPEGLEIAAPPRSLVLAGNIRTQGEVATRSITRHNRTVTARLIVGPAATSAALLSSIRNLLMWLSAPPQIPITLQYQPFNAATPLYLDVVGAAHNLPSDEGQWLRGQFEPLTLTFVCRPGLRGNRVTLSNLVPNAGFEQPTSGPGVVGFNDTFATANAYTLVAGGTPTVAGGVMTIPASTALQFGSSDWGAITLWQLRVQTPAAAGWDFQAFLHAVSAGNNLFGNFFSTGIEVHHAVGGVDHLLNSTAFTALANSTWYWLTLTQFPAAPGEVAMVQVSVNADNAGAIGALIATTGAVPTFDGSTALTGKMQLNTNSTGAWGISSNVVQLFGPGGWAGVANFGTGRASLAWEQNSANTYPGGPVTSLGAARFDFAPSGTVNTGTYSWSGTGSPLGQLGAMPVRASGDVVQVRVMARGYGLGANAYAQLGLNEFDAAGALLRQSFSVTATGIPLNGGWQQLSMQVTTGANTAYVVLGLLCGDTTAGASANGIVWFDNAQLWNETATGQSSMPWCDLRAVVSPATLVVSGVLGDLPAPAHLALGAYISSAAPNLPAGGSLRLYLGRKGITSPNAQLVNQSFGAYDPAFSPQSTPLLDATAYGGGWNPRTLSLTAADASGSYHLLARVLSKQTSGNLPNVSLRVATAQQTHPWFNLPSGIDIVGQWAGSAVAPFTQTNVWTVVDVGPCVLPPFPQGALTDPSKLYLTPRAQWQDTSAVTALELVNWQMLLPVDGSLIVATVNNPSNSSGAISAQWLWAYSDGLLLNRAAASDGPSWLYSLEATPTPNPAAGAGGAGTLSSGAVNVNSGADPCLTLDPTLAGNNGSMGVNQLVALITDQVGTVLPCYTEVSYAPLYLEPK